MRQQEGDGTTQVGAARPRATCQCGYHHVQHDPAPMQESDQSSTEQPSRGGLGSERSPRSHPLMQEEEVWVVSDDVECLVTGLVPFSAGIWSS